jgi:hypothetical protein
VDLYHKTNECDNSDMSCTTTQPRLDDLTPRTNALQSGVRLKRDQTLGFAVHAGEVISCRSGAVWLTPGDGSDVELYAGDSYVARRDGRAVACAVDEATLVLS